MSKVIAGDVKKLDTNLALNEYIQSFPLSKRTKKWYADK